MSTLTIPNVFVNGTTINAAPFNSNFGAITTWSTAIDNTNIGPAGLFPNQLLPTTGAQATFGGTQPYTFPGALAITGALTGATTGAFSGAVSVGSLTGPVTINSPGSNAIAGSTNGGTNKFDIFAGAISVAGVAATAFGFDDGTINVLAVSKTTGNLGLLGALSVGGATPGYVPPVYTAAGAATASTMHIVTGSTILTWSASPISASVTITLSGAAIFASSSSYVVVVNLAASGAYTVPAVYLSGTQFSIQGQFPGTTSGPFTATWIAIGA